MLLATLLVTSRATDRQQKGRTRRGDDTSTADSEQDQAQQDQKSQGKVKSSNQDTEEKLFQLTKGRERLKTRQDQVQERRQEERASTRKKTGGVASQEKDQVEWQAKRKSKFRNKDY